MLWVKIHSTITADEMIGKASPAFPFWNHDKNCYSSFENSPWLIYLGFAICPPGTKEGEMYVE